MILQPDYQLTWDPGGYITIKSNRLYSITLAAADCTNDAMVDDSNESRTELDSHANMPVVGKNAYIVAETGRTVDISPFTPDYKAMTVPLVNAAIQYDSPYSGESCILVIRNALLVPKMRNNLLPPFMLREAGITVNEIPKIQVNLKDYGTDLIGSFVRQNCSRATKHKDI